MARKRNKRKDNGERQWFQYAVRRHTGWRKTQSATTRRRLALRAHKGDLLATARALQALANVTTDPETKHKAQADADYFFKRYRKSKRKR